MLPTRIQYLIKSRPFIKVVKSIYDPMRKGSQVDAVKIKNTLKPLLKKKIVSPKKSQLNYPADPTYYSNGKPTLPAPKSDDLKIPIRFVNEYAEKYLGSLVPLVKTNVVYYSSANVFLMKQDILGIFQKPEERKFDIDWTSDSFDLIKARDTRTLEFLNGYYLVFKDYSHACAFMIETFGSFLDSTTFQAEFQTPEVIIPHFAQPLLNEEISISYNGDETALTIHQKVPASVANVTDLPATKRQNGIIIYNMPYLINAKGVVDNFLWDFDLYPDPSLAVQKLFDNPQQRTVVWLVLFNNSQDPMRFSRIFHAKLLDKQQNYPRMFVELLE